MTVGNRCSVPSTTVQMLSAYRRPIPPSQCLCGNPVRDGVWVRCSTCQMKLMASAPLRSAEVIRFVESHTRECDCGRPRAAEALACPRCLWIDGIPEEEPIIASLRRHGMLSLWEIRVTSGISLKKAGLLMESLLQKHRVVRDGSRYRLTLG